jgi:hypothetical protein
MFNAARVTTAAAALLYLTIAGDASAQTGKVRCLGKAQFVQAASSGVRTTAVNFNTDQFGNPDDVGHFDPVPLLTAVVETTSPSTCLIIHFSSLLQPQDNHAMFQVRVDGIPAEGHAIFPYSIPTVKAPVVWDPEETDHNLTRMVAYDFFDIVPPGTHRVEVRFAGCCGLTNNVTTIAVVRNAVMTLQY